MTASRVAGLPLNLQGRWTALAGAAVAALTVGVGQWIKASGDRLGVFFPPFYAHWYPYAGSLAAVTGLMMAGAAALLCQSLWPSHDRVPLRVGDGGCR